MQQLLKAQVAFETRQTCGQTGSSKATTSTEGTHNKKHHATIALSLYAAAALRLHE
jgi:hypothetical protein